MIGQFHQELLKDSGTLELVGEGLIGRRPLGRQSICVKYLGLAIIGILAMELLQSIRVGTHARSVVGAVRTSVERRDGGYVVALAQRFPTYGLGFLDCSFPLYRHWAGPSAVHTSDGGRRQAPIRHGAIGVFLGNGRKVIRRGGKRERMQHRKCQVELLLDLSLARDWEMHFSEM